MFLQVNKCPGLSFGILFNLPSGRAGNKVALGFSLSTLGEKDVEYIVVSPFLPLESTFPKCYWIGQKKSCFSVGTYSKLSGQPIPTGVSQLGSRELLLLPELDSPHLCPSRSEQGRNEAILKCSQNFC